MIRDLRRWLSEIPHEDPVERQLTLLLQYTLVALAIVYGVGAVLSLFLVAIPTQSWNSLIETIVFVACWLGLLVLLRRGYFKLTSWLIIAVLLASRAEAMWSQPFDASLPGLIVFTIPLVIAGLAVGRSALAAVVIGSTLIVIIAELGDTASREETRTLILVPLAYLLIVGFVAVTLDVFRTTLLNALRQSVQHVRNLERAQAERAALYEEAQEQRERLRVTLTSIGDAVIATDERGLVTFMNPIAQLLTGWDEADALGQPLETVFHIVNEDTREEVESPVKRVLREGVIVGLANHTVLIRRDGEQIAIDDSGAPIRGTDNRLVGAVLVFRDVAEQRRVQAAIAESEGRFRTMANTAPVLIWLSDTTKGRTWFNQQWLNFTGRTFEQERGFGWAEGVHPDDHDRWLTTYADHFETQSAFVMEYRLRRRDGEYRWITAQATPRFDPDGRFLGFIGTCIDITERKHSEERTRLLQQLTAALSDVLTIQGVADTIVGEILGALGSYLGTIYLLSPDQQQLELANRRGLSDELVERYRYVPITLGGPLTDALKDKTPIWLETIDDYIDRYPVYGEIARNNGTQSSVVLPLIAGSRVLGGLTISFRESHVFDPLARAFMIALAQQCSQALERARLYEIETDARRRAEEANELKLKFLAMISHELRTPLTSIKGFTSTLLAEDVEWQPTEQREFIQIMDREADKLTDLVEQLLDVSRMTAGTLRISPERQSLADIFETAMAQLLTLSADHVFALHLPEDLPPVVADSQRVAQVVVNLVDNAAKYSQPGTRIDVEAAQQGDIVQIDVSDQGDGIPPHEREVVFETFRQAERASRQRGAGLGLAICKGVVEAHGGRIWIQDRPGPGTTISFTLPVAKSTVLSAE